MEVGFGELSLVFWGDGRGLQRGGTAYEEGVVFGNGGKDVGDVVDKGSLEDEGVDGVLRAMTLIWKSTVFIFVSLAVSIDGYRSSVWK